MLRNPLLVPDLRELIRAGETSALSEFLVDHHPGHVAEIIEDLGDDEGDMALTLLPDRTRAEVMSYVDPERQVRVVERMAPADAASLLHLMSHDDRAHLVNRLDEDRADEILRNLAQAEREDIRQLASYEPGTAGSSMTTDYATLPPGLTVREALDRLRREAPDRETIDYSYVVDPDHKLLGIVPLKRLILARPLAKVEEIMQKDVISGRVDEDREAVARKVDKYDLFAIPILDASDMLVGIVTHDDAMDILRQEQTEDILAFGGVAAPSEDDDEGNYWQGHVHIGVRRRIGWLLLLFIAGTITRWVIHSFDWVDKHFHGDLEFDAFIPLLIGTGGNAGSQTVGTVIRGLAPEPDPAVRHAQGGRPRGRHRPGPGAPPGDDRLPLRLAVRAHPTRLRPGHRPGDPRHLHLGQRHRSPRPPARPPVRSRPSPRLRPAHQHAGRHHRPLHLLLDRHRVADQAGLIE